MIVDTCLQEWDGEEDEDEDDEGDDDGMFKGTQTLSSLLEDFAGDYRGNACVYLSVGNNLGNFLRKRRETSSVV